MLILTTFSATQQRLQNRGWFLLRKLQARAGWVNPSAPCFPIKGAIWIWHLFYVNHFKRVYLDDTQQWLASPNDIKSFFLTPTIAPPRHCATRHLAGSDHAVFCGSVFMYELQYGRLRLRERTRVSRPRFDKDLEADCCNGVLSHRLSDTERFYYLVLFNHWFAHSGELNLAGNDHMISDVCYAAMNVINECQWGRLGELTLRLEVNMVFGLTVITN